MNISSLQGLTLVSLLVATGLSGVVAVFGVKLITNQMSIANTAEVADKGEAIFRFYKSVLLDSEAWDQILDRNSNIKTYVKGHDTSSSVKTGASLRDAGGNELIPSAGAKLKDGVGTTDPNGWWEVGFFWEGKGRGSVDLILELCLNKTTFQSASENKGRTDIVNSFKHLCPTKRTTRIRYSENSVQSSLCQSQGKAIVSVSRFTDNQSRKITCSGQKLIKTNRFCGNQTFVGSVSGGFGHCASRRTGVRNMSPCRNGSFLQMLSNGNIRCSNDSSLQHRNKSFLINTQRASCLSEPYINGAPQVVCGFTTDMRVLCCRSKGDRGAQGPRGIDGGPGQKGRTGLRGPQGFQGDPQRDIGPKGAKGATGDRGEPSTRGVMCRS